MFSQTCTFTHNTLRLFKRGPFFLTLISYLYICRSYRFNARIIRRKVMSNFIEFSVSLLDQTLRKTRSIDLLSFLGAQPLSVRRRCCTVSMARTRFALLVVCDSIAFLTNSVCLLHLRIRSCPLMSTVAVLQRRQRSRHGQDALEALKFIGSLVLEVVGATEIGRLATKGIKYLIKRQEARTTLLPSPSTLPLTVEGRADGARPERQVRGTACGRQRPVTGLVTSAVS